MRLQTVRKMRDRRGVAAVEFALVLPLLIMLAFGIVEFSILFYDRAMITNASREGARAGIVFRAAPGTNDPMPLSDGEISTIVNSYLAGHLISFGGPATATTTISRAGQLLTVNVTYPYTFLVLPKFATSLVGSIGVSAQTVMRME